VFKNKLPVSVWLLAELKDCSDAMALIDDHSGVYKLNLAADGCPRTYIAMYCDMDTVGGG
jgi:hypothetical protein